MTSVFLDDGGVLNDNEVRAAEWRRLAGDFFAPGLGGDPAAWGRANAPAYEGSWSAFVAMLERGDEFDPGFWPRTNRVWLHAMCADVGVAPPRDDEIDALNAAALAHINERVRAGYPDAVPGVRAIASRGVALHTASGSLSTDLDPLLRGMGIREAFGMLFGPDLVGAWKKGARYYEGIVSVTGVDPRSALVVDDAPHVLDAAADVGFGTALMSRAGGTPTRHRRVRSLAEVAELL